VLLVLFTTLPRRPGLKRHSPAFPAQFLIEFSLCRSGAPRSRFPLQQMLQGPAYHDQNIQLIQHNHFIEPI
jgi:hypothetical protein